MTSFFLVVVVVYLGIGAAFAIWFCGRGVHRIDRRARDGSWGFRVLILPGAALLWPLLLRRMIGDRDHPPEERTAHRRWARTEGRP